MASKENMKRGKLDSINNSSEELCHKGKWEDMEQYLKKIWEYEVKEERLFFLEDEYSMFVC